MLASKITFIMLRKLSNLSEALEVLLPHMRSMLFPGGILDRGIAFLASKSLFLGKICPHSILIFKICFGNIAKLTPGILFSR